MTTDYIQFHTLLELGCGLGCWAWLSHTHWSTCQIQVWAHSFRTQQSNSHFNSKKVKTWKVSTVLWHPYLIRADIFTVYVFFASCSAAVKVAATTESPSFDLLFIESSRDFFSYKFRETKIYGYLSYDRFYNFLICQDFISSKLCFFAKLVK